MGVVNCLFGQPFMLFYFVAFRDGRYFLCLSKESNRRKGAVLVRPFGFLINAEEYNIKIE